MSIQKRTILITGGTAGIGLALARALQPQNRVIVTGRKPEGLAAAQQAGLTAIPCDLTQRADIDRLVQTIEQEHQALDTLINNAGVQFNYDFRSETDPFTRIATELHTNLTGSIQLTQRLMPTLLRNEGTIINVTSALGKVPKSEGLVYSVSKAGLSLFTLALRKILRGSKLKVLELIPPVTATNMTAGRAEQMMQPSELAAIVLKQWHRGRKTLAPFKVRLLLGINQLSPFLANRIIK